MMQNASTEPQAVTSSYYKVLNLDGSCTHGGTGSWDLAHDGQPGQWMPRLDIAKLIPCQYGYHILKIERLVEWLGPAIHRVEAIEPVLWDDNKGVTCQARDLGRIEAWNETTARLFAADCAERVLHIFENIAPGDMRPRKTIEAARQFARQEINDTAWNTARAAARDAARDAAWGAASTAAWDVARDVAWDAASAAARAAAWAAARDAAWGAASTAAWDAAWGAAWAVARKAAWGAAWTREQEWQTKRLKYYLSL